MTSTPAPAAVRRRAAAPPASPATSSSVNGPRLTAAPTAAMQLPDRTGQLGRFRSLGPGGGGSYFAAVFHNTNADVLLAGQDVGGLSMSTDGGRTWRHVNQGGISLPGATADAYWVSEIVAHPTNDDRFFAATAIGLFQSDDVGETWRRLIPAAAPDIAHVGMSWVAFSSRDPQLALAASGDWHEPDGGDGLYRSRDGGRNFARVDAAGIPQHISIMAVAFDPVDASVFAATERGLFRSTDDGDTFSQVDGGFRHDRGHWIGIAADGDGRAFWYVLETLGDDADPTTWAGGLYRSDDGVQWREVPGLPRLHPDTDELFRPLGARIRPGDPNVLYVNLRTVEAQGGTYRFHEQWTDLTAGLSFNIWNTVDVVAPEGLAIFGPDPDLMISCTDLSLLKSVDGGATWAQLSVRPAGDDGWSGTGAEVTVVYDLAVSGQTLYAAFEDIGAWRSDDRGASWRQLIRLLDPTSDTEPDGAAEVRAHPTDSQRVYIARSSWSLGLREPSIRSELAKSTDGGATFAHVTPPGVPNVAGRGALAVAWGETDAQDDILAAFHGDSIYRSRDGGATWQDVSKGLADDDRASIFRLGFDPSDTSRAFAGLFTYGDYDVAHGLYRSRTGGDTWTPVDAYPLEQATTVRFAGRPVRLFVAGWTAGESDASGALLVSDDAGASFRPVLNQPFVHDIIDIPGSPGSLLAASSSTFVTSPGQHAGIYRSDDNGDTWHLLESLLPHTFIWRLAMFPDRPKVLYMATEGAGVIRADLG